MQLVITENEKVTTNSILVARKFGKGHDDVLKAIRNTKCTQEFRLGNFTESSYVNGQNRIMPMYVMTKDGFTLLVMSFTGALAAKFKEEFLKEFNRMEALLKAESSPKPLLPVYSKRIINDEARNCPDTHWCIFTESHSVMIPVEANVGSQCQFDLIDGSIGGWWAKYRKDKPWVGEAVTYKYEFADIRRSVDAKCYPLAELPYFKGWLKNIYKKQHLVDYLKNKYANNSFMLKRVEEFIPKLLKAS